MMLQRSTISECNPRGEGGSPTRSRWLNDIRNRENGFTLIETLVATMILAIGVVMILQLFSGGLRSGKLSKDYSRAIFDAKSKMNEILLVDKLAEGSLRGVFEDGYEWDAVISKVDKNEDEDKKTDYVQRFNIKLTVTWVEGNRNKEFVLDTVQLVHELKEDS